MNNPTMRSLFAGLLAIAIFASSHFSQDRRAEAEALDKEADQLIAVRTPGSQREAMTKYQSAANIWEELSERTKQSWSLLRAGGIMQRLGDTLAAVPVIERSLNLAQIAGDKVLQTDATLTLAQGYGTLGEPRKAIELYRQAGILAREIHNIQYEAISTVGLGFSADAIGDKQGAINYYGQALPVVRSINDKQGECSVMQNLATVYFSLGELDRALPLYKDALAIAEGLKDEQRIAIILNNIGAVFDTKGEPRQAMEYYQRGMDLRKKIGDRVGEAIALNNIAGMQDALGNKDEARKTYERALALTRELKIRGREASTLSNLGKLAFSENNIPKALEYYLQTLPIRREVGDIFGEAKTQSSLASIELIRGNLSEALEHIQGALAIVESVRATLASPELRATYFASIQEFYRIEIDVLMAMHDKEPSKGFDVLALQTSERSRARGLLDLLSEAKADIRQGVDISLLDRERMLQKKLSAKDRERRSAAGAARAPALEKEINDLVSELQDLEGEIRSKNPRYATLTQPRPIALADIQKLLDDDTVLLEYSLGTASSYLWAITKTSIHSYRLAKRSVIEDMARSFYQSVSVKPLSADAGPGTRELGDLLFDPVIKDIAKKRLAIVADGVLGFVPFAALRTTARPGMLIDDHEIVYLPSASTLSALQEDEDTRKTPKFTLAVFADPVFDSSDTRVSRKEPAVKVEDRTLTNVARATRDSGGNGVLPRLPATRREARTILGLVKGPGKRQAVDFDADLATVSLPEIGDYRMIHFATHGFLNSVHPELSGIVLSLVNKNGDPQDGFLRLNDIYNLRLPADLIVLSACKTALGKEVRGEGLVGLTRGFMYAGARRVVASLWAVDDEATAELMENFYKGMLGPKKLRPAAALREAQIAVSKDKRFASPYYWSAFTIQGEWK